MNTGILTNAARNIMRTMNKNSPTILTGLSVAGVITTAVLAVRATPKAMQLLDDLAYAHYMSDRADRNGGTVEQYLEEHQAQGTLHMPVLSLKEIVLETYKEYIPAMVMGSVTVACMIGANSINLRRNAVLASLYSIADTSLKEYQSKVVEQIGAKKEEKIRENLAQEKLNKNPMRKGDVIITGKGDMLCYEEFSGRYFKSDIETIRRVQNDFNAKLLIDNELQLNELYFEMGLAPNKFGDSIGWKSNKHPLEFIFSSNISNDGQPCIVVGYRYLPEAL